MADSTDGAAPQRGKLATLLDAFPDIQRLKTDVFRDLADYSPVVKARLAGARRQGPAAVAAVAATLGADADGAALIDLLLSQRAVRDWQAMIDLVRRLPASLRDTTLVQEQYGLALNRAGRDDEAQAVLEAVLRLHGASSETCALLGRVFKDRYRRAADAGDAAAAAHWLQCAADTYLQGFDADPRDAFPGINALTLMTLRQPPDPRAPALLPRVQAAVQARLARADCDYWDRATCIELAVLAGDEAEARAALARALASIREPWEPESTARNLGLIRRTRELRGNVPAWAAEVERALHDAARR